MLPTQRLEIDIDSSLEEPRATSPAKSAVSASSMSQSSIFSDASDEGSSQGISSPQQELAEASVLAPSTQPATAPVSSLLQQAASATSALAGRLAGQGRKQDIPATATVDRKLAFKAQPTSKEDRNDAIVRRREKKRLEALAKARSSMSSPSATSQAISQAINSQEPNLEEYENDMNAQLREGQDILRETAGPELPPPLPDSPKMSDSFDEEY